MTGFLSTGNIEKKINGKRHLLGQYVNGKFILNGRYATNPVALSRIKECGYQLVAHGRPFPEYEWKEY